MTNQDDHVIQDLEGLQSAVTQMSKAVEEMMSTTASVHSSVRMVCELPGIMNWGEQIQPIYEQLQREWAKVDAIWSDTTKLLNRWIAADQELLNVNVGQMAGRGIQ